MAAERAGEGGQGNGRVKFCAGPVISEGNNLLNRNLLLKLKKVGMVQVEGRLAKLDTFEFALRYLRAHEEDAAVYQTYARKAGRCGHHRVPQDVGDVQTCCTRMHIV